MKSRTEYSAQLGPGGVFGTLLAGAARLRAGLRRCVTHRQEIALAEEDVGFTEADVAFGHLRGLRDDEQRIAVGLDRGPPVRAARVLDRKLLHPGFVLEFFQRRLIGFNQPDPYETVRARGEIADLARVMSRIFLLSGSWAAQLATIGPWLAALSSVAR